MAIVALALTISACGDSGGDSPPASNASKADLQAAVDGLQKSMASGKPAAICAHLTARGQAATIKDIGSGANCEEAVATLVEAYGKNLHTTVEVTAVKGSGDRASATIRAETGNRYTSRFVKEGGRWKLDQSLTAGAA